MADFDLIAQDPERIAETATANLQLTAQENPEAVALGFSKSREMGIPFTWAREMDNVDLHPAYSAEGLHSKFQEHIARNIDKAPLYRNNLVNLNNLAKAIIEAQADLQQRAEIARKRYEEEGLPLPTRLTLQDLGFVQKPDGKFEKDGKAVETPVILGDLVGPEEAAYIDELTGAAKTALDQDMTDWRTYHDLSPEGRKESLLRMVKHMEKVQAVINSLNQSYPEGWIDRTEKEIQELVTMAGERNGVDVSDVDVRALKKGGVLDVDYGEAINVFGLRTLSKRITAPDAEALANIGPESAPSDIEARYYQLREQNKELLGLNLAGKIAYGVTATVPYILELGATAGIATVGKAPLQVALKTILKEGGFTGIKAGAKAIFTKKGLTALGKAGGAVLTAEAKRLPFVGTSIGAEALAEIEPEPVTFFGPDGVRTVVPDRTVGDIFNALVNKTVSRYVANASENTGILVSGFDFTKYVPETMFQKGFQNKVVSRFLADVVANDPARAALLRSGFASANPFGGLGEEVFEEFVNQAADRILTLASEITGAEALDMGAETFFMGPEETFVTAVTALVQSTGGKAMRIPAAAQHTRNLLRFVDSHRKSVEMIQKAIKDLPGGAPEMKEFVSAMRGGDTELAIDPEDAETLYQKNPDIAKKLGLTEARIADAVQKGELVTVSHNDLAIEQATNPEARELTEELLTKVQSGALKVDEALDKKTAAELVESYKAETDRVKTLREKIYNSALEAAREAKIPQEAQKSFATLAGLVTNYLDRHSLEDGRVEEALNRLAIQYKENPGSFSAPDGLEQPVYHGTPHVWAPEPGFPFGRFRLDKLYTGEGRTGSGEGSYLTEVKEVAEWYRDWLSSERPDHPFSHKVTAILSDYLRNREAPEYAINEGALYAMGRGIAEGVKKGLGGSDIVEAVYAEIGKSSYGDKPYSIGVYGPGGEVTPLAGQELKAAIGEVYQAVKGRVERAASMPTPSVYELEIPDKHLPYIMDVEVPLTEQPEAIRGKLENMLGGRGGASGPLTEEAQKWIRENYRSDVDWLNKNIGGDFEHRIMGAEFMRATGKETPLPEVGVDKVTPRDLYLFFSRSFGPKKATELFRQQGVVGLKYKSPEAKNPDDAQKYNFVVWDQKVLDEVAVLKRNEEVLQTYQEALKSLSAVDNQSGGRYIYSKERDYDKVRTHEKTGQDDSSGSRGGTRSEDGSRGASYGLRVGDSGTDRNDGTGSGRRENEGGRLHGRGHSSVQRVLRDALTPLRYYYNIVRRDEPADDLELQELPPEKHGDFCTGLYNFRDKNPYSCCVSNKTPEELVGARVFQSPDGLSGMAVMPDGDMVAAYSTGKRNALFDMMTTAILAGGEKLDCYTHYDKGLWRLYHRWGFIPVCKVKFDEQYRPDDWNDAKFPPNNRPDIVFWIYNGDPVEETIRKRAEGSYATYSKKFYEGLKEFSGDDAYGEAMAYRDAILEQRKRDARNTLYQSAPSAEALDAEYMAALENEDEDALESLVEKAAKMAGYKIGPVYHWGSFDKSQDIPEGAMHFGTEEAANERAYGKIIDDELEGVEAYEGDDGAWHFDTGSETSEDLGYSGYDTEEDAIYEGREYLYSVLNTDSDIPEGEMTAAYLKIDNAKRVRDSGTEWDAKVEKAKAEGYDGIVYTNQFEDKGKDSYIIFSPEQVKSADPVTYDDEGNVIPLSKRFDLTVPDVRYQNRPGTYRGSFTPAQDFNLSFNAVINLFKHADASTLPHETFHWVRQMMKAMVDGGWADTALQQDHETIERWLDRQNYRAEPGTPEYLREREEKGAAAFEEYLRSGRAPNSFVEKAFNTMKKLLTSIYSYVRGALLDVKLDDEITSLFDRMLSTEALVERDAPLKEAVDVLKDNFTALLGISQEEAKGFQTIIREALAQMESSIDGRKVRLLKTLRKTWREEAKALIAESKTYQTWDRVKALGGLNTDFVKKTAGYGKDITAFLRKRGLMAKTTETGIDVPLFAKEAGYASVDALMTDLVEAQTPGEFIGSYIRAKEAEFNANFQLEGDDLSTQASIDLLEKVTEALEQKSGIEGYRAKFRAFEAEVRKSLNGKQVSELVGDRNLVSAMRNTQKKLVAAISKKDYEAALKLLLGLRWNIQSMKERAAARKEIAKVENLYRRLRRVKPGIILGDYHEALKELAYFFGFSTREPKNLKENYREVLGKRIDEETGMETGPFSWPDFLKRENIESYKKLTYGEFQDLRDFTAFLEGTGRDLVSARKGTFANRVQEMLGRSLKVLGEQPKKYHNRKSERNAVASALRYGLNWGLNLRTFLGAADRFSHMEKGAESGPNMALRDAALDGARRQIELETSAKRSISPAIDALKETADGMDVKRGLPEFRRNQLHGYTEWTPEMVISACLNMGTESNRQRLKAGFGWEDSDLDMIAGKLSSSDWRAIQTIWDVLSSELWGAVSQTFFEENHFRLERIPARPLAVSSSDGRVVSLEGGYYPIVYAHHARAKEMPMGFDPRALYSDVSSTHRRAQEIKDPDPLKLSLGVLENHIHSAAAYAAMRMPMRLVLRVVMSPEYADAFIQTQSPEAYESVLAIFRNMANPNPSTERIMNGVEGWARSVLTATALMGNIKTAFAQFTSVTVGMQELGHYYADALLEVMASPVETFARAREFSAMIRHRAEYQDIDLRKSVSAISDGPFDKARRKFVYFGYLAMRGADQIVATVGWHGKYLQALDQLAEKGDPDAYVKAVSLADDFVARTQGAARTLDLTPIQLNSIGRMVSPFITATMAQYNTTLETLGALKEGRLPLPDALLALTGNLFAPVLFQAVLSYIVFGGLLGDDDDDIDRARKMALKEILSSPFAGIPIVRDVASTSAEVIASRMTGAKRNAYGFNLLDAGAVNAVGDLGMDLIQGTEAAYDGNARKAIYLYLKSAGAAAGMPVLHMYEKAIRIWKNNGGEIPEAIDTPSRSKKK